MTTHRKTRQKLCVRYSPSDRFYEEVYEYNEEVDNLGLDEGILIYQAAPKKERKSETRETIEIEDELEVVRSSVPEVIDVDKEAPTTVKYTPVREIGGYPMIILEAYNGKSGTNPETKEEIKSVVTDTVDVRNFFENNQMTGQALHDIDIADKKPYTIREIVWSWYKDSIINAFFAVMLRKCNIKNFQFVTTNLSDARNYSRQNRKRSKYWPEVKNIDNVLLPYNKGQSHWVLYHLHKKDGKCYLDYLDSFNLPGVEKYNTHGELLPLYESIDYIMKQWGETTYTLREIKYKKDQHDSLACGVYVCFAATMLMLGASARQVAQKYISKEFIQKMRNYVFQQLKPFMVKKLKGGNKTKKRKEKKRTKRYSKSLKK